MSAQVFNPMAISEFRRLVNNNNSSNNNNCSIDRIRRNLFGPVDRDESRALAERELAKIRRIDMENWSFDFAKEEPVNGPDSKFVWERLTPGDVHESYALRRFEYLGMAATTNNTTVPSVPASDAVSTSERTKSQQQKQITDYFLASRRRPSTLSLSTSSKKLLKSTKKSSSRISSSRLSIRRS